MNKLIWLDDVRNPLTHDWLNFSPIGRDCNVIWVKSFADFCAYIVKNGLPTAICFDHDLGVKYPSNAKELVANGGKFVELTSGTYIEGTVEYPTGMDCAKFLVDYCLDTEQELPLFASQSANPSGRENILGLLNNFKKFKDENRMEK